MTVWYLRDTPIQLLMFSQTATRARLRAQRFRSAPAPYLNFSSLSSRFVLDAVRRLTVDTTSVVRVF